jgi:aspartate aminotransferase/aminotransferase
MPQVTPRLVDYPLNPLFRVAGAVDGRDDVIHLEFGEPDFPTPAHIVEAAHRSLRDERQRYLPSSGILSLRETIAARVARVNGFTPSAKQIVVTPGGTGGVMASLQATCAAGDEVLVPDPAWPGYDSMVAAIGARMVRYPLLSEAGWLPDLDALEAAISPRTRVLVVNSPSNPGGAVFTPETMRALVEIAHRHDLWLVSDECYDEIVFEGMHLSPATLDSHRIITVGTCSKSYAMTGWRIGWVVAPAPLAPSVALMVGAQMNNLALFVQRAAEAALSGPQACVREMAASYRARRDFAVEMLRSRGLLEYVPAGAFYLLVPVAKVAPAERETFDGVGLAMALVAERKIAVAPGPSFGAGAARYARVSLASAAEDLRAGIEGLLDFAATWDGGGTAAGAQ